MHLYTIDCRVPAHETHAHDFAILKSARQLVSLVLRNVLLRIYERGIREREKSTLSRTIDNFTNYKI